MPYATLVALVALLIPLLRGRTVGSWLCDLHLDHADGQPPGFWRAWFRNGLALTVVGLSAAGVILAPFILADLRSTGPGLVAGWVALLGGAAFNLVVVHRTGRSLADHVFGTRQVHRPRPIEEEVVLLDPGTGLPRGMRPPADDGLLGEEALGDRAEP